MLCVTYFCDVINNARPAKYSVEQQNVVQVALDALHSQLQSDYQK